ncbi:MAG: DNA methylase [Candidatus Accumulibacter appositus]|mgnify:FL=1|uniref:DNA methylase n=1 Tax=Candidatus Accumulibacter appositus TaxID=1454003 RepID=A0A011QUM4_9PROT|nr:DNA methyltransferase [Accumulibacter sp.]EXI82564.1 MAG: DNA methylase [Candidatus Accumulibacter appositus]HRF05012.1 DNA methyltransferase [Accumulibacter sp.]
MNDFFQNHGASTSPVECLGQTFPSEQARREHFLKLLAERLKEPAFRKTEGFPQGTDEAILAMSDPPYYTACPNPFLEEFVRHYGKPYDPSVKYNREPQTIDVSVGKTDPLYKAHSYHTKVPHLAIVPSILHYTEPGDIVLDGFSGSGMTGVATQWCGSAPTAYRHELEMEWKKQGKAAPKWGSRRVILNDLSPAATFIAANYNLPFDVEAFANAGKQLLKEVEQELGWMYETLHKDGKTKGRIEYTVWSQIYSCPECAGEVNFIDEALDDESKRVKDSFPCPHCGAELTKKKMERLFAATVDSATGKTLQTPKRQPSLIIYSVAGSRHQKSPDKHDLEVLNRIDSMALPIDVPTMEIPPMHMTHERARMDYSGITNIHHFFLPRALHSMAALWRKASTQTDARVREMLLFFVEQALWTASLLNRYRPTGFSQVNQYMTGVYYVASQHAECSPWYILDGKLGRLAKTFQAFGTRTAGAGITTTGSVASLPLADGSIDYIFTDPPFGENIYYADLNFLVESWHRVTTDAGPEAIVDRFKKKALPEYQHLMRRCFSEYFRVLKPGRWMTVVFSNSKAAVWNAIQVALQQAGFVVAEVTALDKVQGSYRQVTSATAMKQDLVISAYKPNGGLEGRFTANGATADSAWDFVQTHLKQLPVVKVTGGDFPELVFNIERDARRIKDRLDAWFIRHGAMVPFSSPDFIAELAIRFKMIDGMTFLPDQAVEYEKARSRIPQVKQADLFVSDERSAIDWLTSFLLRRPSTRAEVAHEYIPQIGSARKKGELIPELDELLDDNFLRYDGNGDVPSQIHSYLSTNHKDLRSLDKSNPALVAKAKDRWYVPDPNKAQDLEKKREKALLKEFEIYKAFTGRKIKESRLEVLRTGFRSAWANKDYTTIISVANKLPEETLQEDEKLLTLYDLALTRTEAGA